MCDRDDYHEWIVDIEFGFLHITANISGRRDMVGQLRYQFNFDNNKSVRGGHVDPREFGL